MIMAAAYQNSLKSIILFWNKIFPSRWLEEICADFYNTSRAGTLWVKARNKVNFLREGFS
jgi:hypothetical protein